jgi:hypothetical protein
MDYQYTLPLEYFKQLKTGQKTFVFDMQDAITNKQLEDDPVLDLRQGDTVQWNIAVPPGVSMVTWESTYDERIVMLKTNTYPEKGKEETLWPMGYDQMNPKPPVASLETIKLIKATTFKIRPLKDIKILNIKVSFLISDPALYEAWRVGGSPPANTDYPELVHEFEENILISRFSDMPSGPYRVMIPQAAVGWELSVNLLSAPNQNAKIYLAFDAPPVKDIATSITDEKTSLTRLWAGEQMKAIAMQGELTVPVSMTDFLANNFIADRSRWLYIDFDFPSGKALTVTSRIHVFEGEYNPEDYPDYEPPALTPFPKPFKPSIDFPPQLPYGDEFPPKNPNTQYMNTALDLASKGNMLKDPLKDMCIGAESGLDSMIDSILVSPYKSSVNFKELFNKVINFGIFSRDMQAISSQMFGNAGDKELISMPYSFAKTAAPVIGTNIPTVNTVLSIAQYKQTSNYYGERTQDACSAIRDIAGGLLQLGSDMVDKIGSIANEIKGIVSQVGQSIAKITSMIGAAVAKISQVMSDMMNGAINCIKNIGDAMEQLIRESTAGMIRSLNQLNPCASGVLLGDTLGGTPGILSPEMGELVREAPQLYNIDIDF